MTRFCMMCGKTDDHPGWDESCMLNCVELLPGETRPTHKQIDEFGIARDKEMKDMFKRLDELISDIRNRTPVDDPELLELATRAVASQAVRDVGGAK